MDILLSFSIFLIFIVVVIIVLLLFKIIGHAYTFLFWGAIYVPTTQKRVEKMVELLKIKPGQIAVDLGAGDGRLVIALAKAGAKAYGCEVNPFLVSLAKKNIKKAGLEGKAFVVCRSLWREDLSNFDVIAVYGMRHMMKGLEKKFERELKPGVKIISNYFTFPEWKPEIEEDNIYLYIKK